MRVSFLNLVDLGSATRQTSGLPVSVWREKSLLNVGGVIFMNKKLKEKTEDAGCAPAHSSLISDYGYNMVGHFTFSPLDCRPQPDSKTNPSFSCFCPVFCPCNKKTGISTFSLKFNYSCAVTPLLPIMSTPFYPFSICMSVHQANTYRTLGLR